MHVPLLLNSCLATHFQLSFNRSQLNITKKEFLWYVSLWTIAEKEYLFAWTHYCVYEANEVKESILFSLLKECTSQSNVLILRRMEWGPWRYKHHTLLLPLDSILVSLDCSRNSWRPLTLTKEVLPCFRNILTSRLLLSWLDNNAILHGCTILLKLVWIFKRWTVYLGKAIAAAQWHREWIPGASS